LIDQPGHGMQTLQRVLIVFNVRTAPVPEPWAPGCDAAFERIDLQIFRRKRQAIHLALRFPKKKIVIDLIFPVKL